MYSDINLTYVDAAQKKTLMYGLIQAYGKAEKAFMRFQQVADSLRHGLERSSRKGVNNNIANSFSIPSMRVDDELELFDQLDWNACLNLLMYI